MASERPRLMWIRLAWGSYSNRRVLRQAQDRHLPGGGGVPDVVPGRGLLGRDAETRGRRLLHVA